MIKFNDRSLKEVISTLEKRNMLEAKIDILVIVYTEKKIKRFKKV
ncbi:hypothetical protein HNR74_000949 [Flammeovirga kamogawensis]|nr:hypothetical protein [Flammeovirga kamogawensis]